MKILHIISGDLGSGAARGAYWLHKGLVSLGVDSKILTNSMSTFGDVRVTSVNTSKKQKIMCAFRAWADAFPSYLYPNRKKVYFSTGCHGFDFTKHPLYEWADIIHLHWINEGFVNIKHLSRTEKPIVWTIRDMWPLTGGCHYAPECDKYKNGCGNCVQLSSKTRYDLSRIVYRRKQKYFPKTISVVGISEWLSAKARESELFKGFEIRTISNNINMDDFFPLDKSNARNMLGISTSKKIILVGSQYLTDIFKGFDKYLEAVRRLDSSKYYLVFFGRLDENIVESIGFEYKVFGFLQDAISLRILYSASDVFVAPSIIDAFGKTLAESMACGTPVVCFDAAGPKDIVDHKVNGYKARPFDAADLADGIEYILNATDYDALSKNAREKVVREFDNKVVALKYSKLYEEKLKSA